MLIQVVLFSFIAGITVFIGAFTAFFFENKIHNKRLKELVIRYLVAFATGIMLSAISFVLIPKGMESISIFLSVILFLFGGVLFYFFDKMIQKHKTKIPQVLAMLLDFIPESIALGAVFMYDHKTGILLSFFIALQNYPEAFNSYVELKNNRIRTQKALIIFFTLSFVGVIFSLLGYYFLMDKPQITSALMVFAAGGIMYIIFQDIAPLLTIKEKKPIAIGVNIGFIIGMLGEALI